MGLFTSTCKGCGADIDWFLDARAHNCKCGTHMTAKEVQKSWDDNYFDSQVRSCVARLEKGLPASLGGFSEQFANKILLAAKQRMKEDK